MGTFSREGISFRDGLGYSYLNITVLVAILPKNSFGDSLEYIYLNITVLVAILPKNSFG